MAVRIGSLVMLREAEYRELVDSGKFVEGVAAGEVLAWNDLLRASMAADAYLHSSGKIMDPAGRAICDGLSRAEDVVVAIGAALRINGGAVSKGVA